MCTLSVQITVSRQRDSWLYKTATISSEWVEFSLKEIQNYYGILWENGGGIDIETRGAVKERVENTIII